MTVRHRVVSLDKFDHNHKLRVVVLKALRATSVPQKLDYAKL